MTGQTYALGFAIVPGKFPYSGGLFGPTSEIIAEEVKWLRTYGTLAIPQTTCYKHGVPTALNA